jgi:cytoskeletal protein CcmA (bactofilin family)
VRTPDESVIDAGTRVRGGLHCQEPLAVRGRVDGSIHSEATVTVHEGAVVRGDVVASEVVVSGILIGALVGRERVAVLASGRVRGDVHTPRLRTEPGARIDGELSVGDVADLPELAAPRMPPQLAAVPSDDEDTRRRVVVVKKRS